MFLRDSYDADKRKSSNATNQIREELVHRNYFSSYDIAVCRDSSIAAMVANANFAAIEELHQNLVAAYPER